VHHIWTETIDPFTELGGHGAVPHGRECLLDRPVRYVGSGLLDILLHLVAGAGENRSLLVHDVIGTPPRGMSIVELQDLHG
jgi:hypothetical protein